MEFNFKCEASECYVFLITPPFICTRLLTGNNSLNLFMWKEPHQVLYICYYRATQSGLWQCTNNFVF